MKSTFFEIKRFNSAKLQRINALLNRQNAQLLAKFDQCREKNVHSNIEKQLTNVDIKQMSWLSLNEIIKIENENNNDENENENIENIIFQRNDLQRNLKWKITSNISSEF